MSATEMELRVAKAICAADGHDWNDYDAIDQGLNIRAARAAIRAMREPTKAMIKEGARLHAYDDARAEDVNEEAAKWSWVAMIDSASPEANTHGR